MEAKKKKFKLFDMNKDGKGAEEENRKPTFAFFFKLIFRKFPQLLTLNLLMIFQAIPLVVIALVYFIGDKTPTATNILFIPLYGINQIFPNPEVSVWLDLSSVQMGLPSISPTMGWIMIGLIAFLGITWGWQNVGATYVLRGLVRGDAVFVFSDFFYAIKRNFKQAFFMGLIDFIICAILAVDFIYFNPITGGSFGIDIMYFMIIALIIIYVIMRFYIYHLLVTFDLKNFKILKNALIFSILGIKRNILALLGILLLTVLHIVLIILLIPVGISLSIVIPMIYIFAATAFMGAYAAYPVIDKYMIKPYQTTDDSFIYFKENKEESDVVDPIEE